MVTEAAAELAEAILCKTQSFVSENRNKMEKSASIKTLVLLLKPLEESIKLAGVHSDKLPA